MPGIDPTIASVAVVLLARSAIAAAPRRDMEMLAAAMATRPTIGHATYAFLEQGEPSLRDTLRTLRDEGFAEIRIVPLLLPMEPSFQSWIANTVVRWQTDDALAWPTIRIGPGLAPEAMTALVGDLVDASAAAAQLAAPGPPTAAGSLISTAARRVLVCQGAPCNEAGAAVIWGHLRNEQARLGLRKAGQGTMSAKTTCLGPCALAPVIQVWPEGTVYGGVDENGVDRIIAEHLLGGAVVEDLAYARDGKKQFLRPKPRSTT